MNDHATGNANRGWRMSGGLFLGALLISLPLGRAYAAATSGGADMGLDLRNAVVVAPADAPQPERKAVAMLLDEVVKRTRLRWRQAEAWPADAAAVIAVGQPPALGVILGPYADVLGAEPAPTAAEGFRLRVLEKSGAPPLILVAGNDPRGVLFGVGRLLRELAMSRDAVGIPRGIDVRTAPKYPLRGHQLGYRPKVNSYDGWTVPMWEQYFRDLAVFGTNAIELIPPRSDDATDSPHFVLPPIEMLANMSQVAADYDLDVWIWYPAMDPDYSKPATVESALKEWGGVFEKLPRLDAVFVPGGDPGHTRPKHLLAFLEQVTDVLHRTHPKARMWMSPQSFNQEWMDEFLSILQDEKPTWLSGIVFGPQNRSSLPDLRAAVPAQYPIRHYPDITHSIHCQFPVPDWDLAYASTEQREVINPRPTDEANIIRLLDEYTIGFLAYSEGCNDDVNKIVWSCLGWDPDMPVIDVLRQYARYFIGKRYEDDFAQGLLALERNWRGPLLTNGGVFTTLEQFQAMERSAGPQDLLNWRFQQALYRAYYDAYDARRLAYETDLEQRAMDVLRQPRRLGSLTAMDAAQAVLDRALLEPVGADLRARVFELAEALYQSIRMQLSVPRYKAISVDRGANLDLIDMPLNDRPWLKARFAALRQMPAESDRLKALDEILNWTNPGPGGFYDDLGNLTCQPRLVRDPQAESPAPWEADPEFRRVSLVGFEDNREWRLSWRRHAESRYDAPLLMRYDDLDPTTQYTVRVVYAGDEFRPKIRLVANDAIEIHPYIPKPQPVQPVEFDIPRDATAGGRLTLSWNQEPGRGGNGRGCQVAEVWLIKKQNE